MAKKNKQSYTSIKNNSKCFVSYSKRSSKLLNNFGLMKNESGEMRKAQTSEILSNQFKSVFTMQKVIKE